MFIALRRSPRSSQTPSATFSMGNPNRTSPRDKSAPRAILWKVGMAVLIACLLASMAIAIVRLATTPKEILGDGFRGLPADHCAT